MRTGDHDELEWFALELRAIMRDVVMVTGGRSLNELLAPR